MHNKAYSTHTFLATDVQVLYVHVYAPTSLCPGSGLLQCSRINWFSSAHVPRENSCRAITLTWRKGEREREEEGRREERREIRLAREGGRMGGGRERGK